MSHDAVKWIAVHFCGVCGDYANEVSEAGTYYVEGFFLSKCSTCGLLACESCKNDWACCDRRGEIESEDRPKAGQLGLFEGA